MLFRPELLISHFIPALNFLRVVPTILLYFLFIIWLFSEQKRDTYYLFGIFIVVILISSLFAENTGRARIVAYTLIELYLLSLVTINILKSKEMIEKIFNLYQIYFLYVAIGGIIGFLMTGRGIVTWDWVLAEEDAFGPLMCMGTGFSLYYAMARDKDSLKYLSMIAIILCMLGVVLSFARGAFLVLISIFLLFLYRYERRTKAIIILCSLSLVIYISASIVYPNNVFWEEIITSTEGFKSGTGHDRKVLWSLAWEEFKDNPIIGVGPNNYGVVSERYLDRIEDKGHYRVGAMYGRALHNGFLQILCELGILGFALFSLLLVDFYTSNRGIRRYVGHMKNITNINLKPYYLSLGLDIGLFAFILNAIIYDIIFYNWLWIVLVLNRSLTFIIQDDRDDLIKLSQSNGTY